MALPLLPDECLSTFNLVSQICNANSHQKKMSLCLKFNLVRGTAASLLPQLLQARGRPGSQSSVESLTSKLVSQIYYADSIFNEGPSSCRNYSSLALFSNSIWIHCYSKWKEVLSLHLLSNVSLSFIYFLNISLSYCSEHSYHFDLFEQSTILLQYTNTPVCTLCWTTAGCSSSLS